MKRKKQNKNDKKNGTKMTSNNFFEQDQATLRHDVTKEISVHL